MIAGGENIYGEKRLENSWEIIICGNKRKEMVLSNGIQALDNGVVINGGTKKGR